MEKIKKTGVSCWYKKDLKRENINDKLYRWRMNIKYIYQRAKYGYCDRDIWSIDYWFLEVMPGMLQQLKENTDSYPCTADFPAHAVFGTKSQKDIDTEGMQNWHDILSEMIFLFKEANEDTCSRKNKFEEKYNKAQAGFEAKYGLFGEKLKTEEDKEREKDTRSHIVYMLGDAPEYKEISDLYFDEQKNIEKYRDECKDKAFVLFAKWFWHLWD